MSKERDVVCYDMNHCDVAIIQGVHIVGLLSRKWQIAEPLSLSGKTVTNFISYPYLCYEIE